MKKIAMFFALALALGAQSLHAAGGSDAAASFWQKLRAKIEALTPQKKLGVTTATGGVRGAPVSANDMYWKNEATGLTVAAEELEDFKKAMNLAGAGDKAQAHAAFAGFIKKYPASQLRKDADEALALLGHKTSPGR